MLRELPSHHHVSKGYSSDVALQEEGSIMFHHFQEYLKRHTCDISYISWNIGTDPLERDSTVCHISL
jgi:hypothetical protein